MLKLLKIVHGLAREHILKPIARSGEWPTVRKHFLEKHPTCAACGCKSMLNVHHIQPFHEFPQLELDGNNLITLCIKNLCHLEIGHGDSYRFYNANIIKDAAEVLAYPEHRDVVIAMAKVNRKPG
jgi:5-methylcytosine-specific restriction protein A